MRRTYIFSDVQGTLVHLVRAYDGLVQLPNRSYISTHTLALIEAIRSTGAMFTLTTGMRKSSYEKHLGTIPHDLVILEYGGVVLRDGEIDEAWSDHLTPWNELLRSYEAEIQQLGYRTDSNGRFASFRIYNANQKKNDLSEDQKRALESLVRPEGLTMVRNLSYFDVIPTAASKAEAMHYVLRSQGAGFADTFALGDDLADHDMLRAANSALTLASAHHATIHLVGEIGGYLSPHRYHRGTEDILQQVLNQLSERTIHGQA